VIANVSADQKVSVVGPSRQHFKKDNRLTLSARASLSVLNLRIRREFRHIIGYGAIFNPLRRRTRRTRT
jgi:hypothetical protein